MIHSINLAYFLWWNWIIKMFLSKLFWQDIIAVPFSVSLFGHHLEYIPFVFQTIFSLVGVSWVSGAHFVAEGILCSCISLTTLSSASCYVPCMHNFLFMVVQCKSALPPFIKQLFGSPMHLRPIMGYFVCVWVVD
jgi:hypothetical protein